MGYSFNQDETLAVAQYLLLDNNRVGDRGSCDGGLPMTKNRLANATELLTRALDHLPWSASPLERGASSELHDEIEEWLNNAHEPTDESPDTPLGREFSADNPKTRIVQDALRKLDEPPGDRLAIDSPSEICALIGCKRRDAHQHVVDERVNRQSEPSAYMKRLAERAKANPVNLDDVGVPHFPADDCLPQGFVAVACCAGCGVRDEPGARHFSECPACPGELVRPSVDRQAEPGADHYVGEWTPLTPLGAPQSRTITGYQPDTRTGVSEPTETVTCNACERDLSETQNSGDTCVVVLPEGIPNHSGVSTLVASYPWPQQPLHFCGKRCLREWVLKNVSERADNL